MCVDEAAAWFEAIVTRRASSPSHCKGPKAFSASVISTPATATPSANSSGAMPRWRRCEGFVGVHV